MKQAGAGNGRPIVILRFYFYACLLRLAAKTIYVLFFNQLQTWENRPFWSSTLAFAIDFSPCCKARLYNVHRHCGALQIVVVVVVLLLLLLLLHNQHASVGDGAFSVSLPTEVTPSWTLSRLKSHLKPTSSLRHFLICDCKVIEEFLYYLLKTM